MSNNYLRKGDKIPNDKDDYMAFNHGKNRFRVLTEVMKGWEDWKEDKGKRTPLRYAYDNKPTVIYAKKEDGKPDLKYVMWCVVWNYEKERIQILEMTQAALKNFMTEKVNSDDEGDLTAYDIEVIRVGTTKNDTKYAVASDKKSSVHPEIAKRFREKPCNLEALLEGDNPFAVNPSEGFTPAAFSEEKAAPVSSRMEKESKTTVSSAQKTSLEELIHKLNQEGVESAMVEDFVDSVAKKQTKSIEQVLMQCLKAYNSFKTSYSVFLNKRLNEQGSPHPA